MSGSAAQWRGQLDDAQLLCVSLFRCCTSRGRGTLTFVRRVWRSENLNFLDHQPGWCLDSPSRAPPSSSLQQFFGPSQRPSPPPPAPPFRVTIPLPHPLWLGRLSALPTRLHRLPRSTRPPSSTYRDGRLQVPGGAVAQEAERWCVRQADCAWQWARWAWWRGGRGAAGTSEAPSAARARRAVAHSGWGAPEHRQPRVRPRAMPQTAFNVLGTAISTRATAPRASP